jgi:hypothetical protein
VELFEELRREYEFGVGSVAGVARKFRVHRRLVRQALGGAVPQERLSKGRPRPKMGPLAEYIDGILEADLRAPRKQRHTAHSIWVRVTKERTDVQIADSTVRQYVRERGCDGATDQPRGVHPRSTTPGVRKAGRQTERRRACVWTPNTSIL